MRTRTLLALAAFVSSPAWAIFTNGGFETGDFTGWTKAFGLNPGLTGAPPFNGGNIVINAGGSDISAVAGAGADPRAPLLTLPRAGSFTARVNDSNTGAIINQISQQAPITEADRDAVDNKLHVRFSYAAVVQDPGHTPREQPYFFVQLKNITTNQVLYEDFTYSGQPGKTFTGPVLAGWFATNFINTDIIVPDANIGDTLQILTIGADCSLGAHGGYVYLDGFGSQIIPPPEVVTEAVIPTLSEWALILLSLAIAGIAFGYRRSWVQR